MDGFQTVGGSRFVLVRPDLSFLVLFGIFPDVSGISQLSGSSEPGWCRMDRSEIPHFSSKLQLSPLS